MRRLPLADELPYRFYPPQIQPLAIRLGGIAIARRLRRELQTTALEVTGQDVVDPLIARGDGVLIAANHCDNADAGVMFQVARRLGRPFYYMAAYQLFGGLNRFILPRLGAFPVDREGTDLNAFKAGVAILAAGTHPLVVFPEGEVYHMGDRLTPLREGAAALATTAVRKRSASGGNVWIVPVAIKYRFVAEADPLPALEQQITTLEARFNWWPRTDHDLVERIYFYAEALLALKELEYLGSVQHGPIPGRVLNLRTTILGRIEDKRLSRRSDEDDPTRVKELRHACLAALAAEGVSADEATAIRHDLNDLFVAVQLYSYPGDYVRECPTFERIAETLMKFEQDVFAIGDMIRPIASRRACVHFGEPIDVSAAIATAGKPRLAAASLTATLQQRIQQQLDALGPGRPYRPDSLTSRIAAPPGRSAP